MNETLEAKINEYLMKQREIIQQAIKMLEKTEKPRACNESYSKKKACERAYARDQAMLARKKAELEILEEICDIVDNSYLEYLEE